MPKISRAWLFALLLFGTVATVCAEGIEVRAAALSLGDEGYVLNADFDLSLSPAIEETLNRGVALNFVLEFELIRPRWYWFNEKLASVSQPYKLSYNALTRQYRLSLGTLFQNFASLADAVSFMSRPRNVMVADRNALQKDTVYSAAVRLRLDVSQLPKPFQISALGSREWNIGSDWFRWTVTP
ncbi:MAG TPA: DUF4390 domain-containing protein [Burkholderiales bacterium]|nr:DUF4390 domain-containing protein [Burkholderiales bacterium]